MEKTSIRLATADDVKAMIDYFDSLTPNELAQLGMDKKKFPQRSQWYQHMVNELQKPPEEKRGEMIALIQDKDIIGHCLLNHIKYGDEAHIHIHLWHLHRLSKGLKVGPKTVLKHYKAVLELFFEKFKLKKLIAEINIDNKAANIFARKLGFIYLTKATKKANNAFNEHVINHYELTKKEFQSKLNTGNASQDHDE